MSLGAQALSRYERPVFSALREGIGNIGLQPLAMMALEASEQARENQQLRFQQLDRVLQQKRAERQMQMQGRQNAFNRKLQRERLQQSKEQAKRAFEQAKAVSARDERRLKLAEDAAAAAAELRKTEKEAEDERQKIIQGLFPEGIEGAQQQIAPAPGDPVDFRTEEGVLGGQDALSGALRRFQEAQAQQPPQSGLPASLTGTGGERGLTEADVLNKTAQEGATSTLLSLLQQSPEQQFEEQLRAQLEKFDDKALISVIGSRGSSALNKKIAREIIKERRSNKSRAARPGLPPDVADMKESLRGLDEATLKKIAKRNDFPQVTRDAARSLQQDLAKERVLQKVRQERQQRGPQVPEIAPSQTPRDLTPARVSPTIPAAGQPTQRQSKADILRQKARQLDVLGDPKSQRIASKFRAQAERLEAKEQKKRVNSIIDDMVESGQITALEGRAAKAKQQIPRPSGRDVGVSARYLLSMEEKSRFEAGQPGFTPAERIQRLKNIENELKRPTTKKERRKLDLVVPAKDSSPGIIAQEFQNVIDSESIEDIREGLAILEKKGNLVARQIVEQDNISLDEARRGIRTWITVSRDKIRSFERIERMVLDEQTLKTSSLVSGLMRANIGPEQLDAIEQEVRSFSADPDSRALLKYLLNSREEFIAAVMRGGGENSEGALQFAKAAFSRIRKAAALAVKSFNAKERSERKIIAELGGSIPR